MATTEERLKYIQEAVNTILHQCSGPSLVDAAMRNAARFVQNAIDGEPPEFEELPKGGDISDGYHTFNELYHHRAILFSVICNMYPERAWKSKQHDTGDMYEGMFIVGIETPEGQATYHYDLDPYWDLFKVKELDKAPKWDGHTPEEAIRRIATLSDVPAFKYGQLLVSNQETEIERAITGEKVKVPAGNRVVVGFDQLAHHLWDGSIQPFSKHIMIGGYSNTGIVAAIWERICAEFPVSEMLDEFEIQPKDVTDTIKNALEEIGLYE